MFSGSCVALVTPFKDGKVDFTALGNLIDFQLKSGTDAIVILGTTGEPATLNTEEKKSIFEFSRDKIKGKAEFILGAGSNSTATAIEKCKLAESYGADAVLIITPYYNKCTQKGLIEHYTAIHNSTDLPIIAYNVPGRTGVNMLPETVKYLADNGIIAGLKESSGNVEQFAEIARLTRGKIALYSGEDALIAPLMSLGAQGVISVVANVVPSEVKKLTSSALSGDFATARDVQLDILPLVKAMFIEVNPIPAKTALSYMGKCSGELRLPLCPPEDKNAQIIKNTLKDFNLI